MSSDQPEKRIQIEGGIYFNAVTLKRDMLIPQHTHDHDHATYCARGRADLYIDGEFAQEVNEGDAVEIKGGRRHEFLCREDETVLVCIWPESIAEAFQ